ncbi:MAG TPA: plastocyanin/azurin family copper-binding protein [Candidatus Limnocylindrales bacterium]|jgi:plastocyanin|nr:plastocyanin/azurin family copper-binding protein [Candidatus Limnocylindrales bacterium]
MHIPTPVEQPRALRKTLGLAVAGILSLTLLACSGSSPSPSAGGTSGGGGASPAATIKMTNDLKFDPATVTIKVGQTVRWENAASIQHSTTDDPSKAQKPEDAKLPSGAKSWDSGLLDPNGSFDETFTVAGDYTYFCLPHEGAGMIGHITVEP